MALGDLVTEDYQFEYNGLLFGANTDYGLYVVEDLLGFNTRSQTTTRFGRHGAWAGRHYATKKLPTFEGKIVVDDDADFQTKRQALGAAFDIVVEPDNALPMVFMLPGSASLKVQSYVRPLYFKCAITREHSNKLVPFEFRLEQPDPILYGLTETVQAFTVPTDTQTLTNAGNAPAKWTATLIGPAENPSLTHTGTGQVLSFNNLILGGSDTLVFDSSAATVKVNGATVATYFDTNFSWFSLGPGDNVMTFTATNADSASFSMAFRDGYWIN